MKKMKRYFECQKCGEFFSIEKPDETKYVDATMQLPEECPKCERISNFKEIKKDWIKEHTHMEVDNDGSTEES